MCVERSEGVTEGGGGRDGASPESRGPRSETGGDGKPLGSFRREVEGSYVRFQRPALRPEWGRGQGWPAGRGPE